MEIKLAESELHFLTEKYAGSEISLEITGEETFTIYHPKANISCEILGHTGRSVVIGYSLGFWKNLLVNWFVKFEKEGITWDKRQKRFEINPFSFLPEKEKIATADFSIKGISIQPGNLQIQIDIMPSRA